MINQGDIALADLNPEVRIAVLVLSNRRFHELTGRALVAPTEQPEPFPWRIEHDNKSFAIDLCRTVSLTNLSGPTNTASAAAQRDASRALHFITS